MDVKRANEILSSADMINVTYNSAPVYIEKVNEAASTCAVHYIGNTQKKDTVPVWSLIED